MKNAYSLLMILTILTVTSGCQTYNNKTVPDNEDDKLNLTLCTDKEMYASGENIEATIVLSNDFDETVLVNKRMAINLPSMIGSLWEVYFVITNPEGTEEILAVRVNVRYPVADDFVIMKPGEEISQTYVLNDWYFISSTPGEFTIQAIYQNDENPDDNQEAWKGKITSNVVHLTINP